MTKKLPVCGVKEVVNGLVVFCTLIAEHYGVHEARVTWEAPDGQ